MAFRKFIALTFVSLLWFAYSYGQDGTNKKSALAQIILAVQEINEYKNYNVVTIDESEEFLGHGTDNGGSLNGYCKGDSLKKIVEWVGLSNRVVQNEYFLDNGELVFVYSTNSTCKADDKTGEIDCSKFEKVFEGRYYFSDGQLIYTILSDKEHEKTKQQDAADFLASSKKYVKFLNRRK